MTFSSAWAAAAPPIKIMPLGDSITLGSQGGYRSLLFNMLNNDGYSIDFVGSSTFSPDWPRLADPNHEGHGGWRIDNIKRHIVDWLNTYDPDVIPLHIGTNDISNGETGISVSKQLWFLLQTIYQTKPNVRVYVASTIIRTDNAEKEHITDIYAQHTPMVVQNWADQGYDCHFVPMHDALIPRDLTDHIHPTHHGYNKMAIVWHNFIDLGDIAPMVLHVDTQPRGGQPVTLTAAGADANEQVQFYGTLSSFGSTSIGDLGVTLDLNEPVILGSAQADEAGNATLSGTISADRAGHTVWLQAAAEGKTSQVLVKAVGY